MRIKFPIALRLFLAVLLAILSVAAVVVMVMRDRFSHNFYDYATKIELDRLDDLSHSLQTQYHQHQNWNFISGDASEKALWLQHEVQAQQQRKLEQFQQELISPPPPQKPQAPPAPPAAPAPPAPPHLPALPAPTLPTEAPDVSDDEPSTLDAPPNTVPEPLLARISLVDQNGRYLAGRSLDGLGFQQRAIYDPTQSSTQSSTQSQKQVIAYLRVKQSAHPNDALAAAFWAEQKRILLLIIIVSLVLSALVASLLAWQFRKPILALLQAAQRLTDGQYGIRLQTQRSDELGELSERFNQLAKQLDQAETLRRQWVADTSHELRTPMSVLRAQVEAMQDGIRDCSPENLALMHKQIMFLNKIIDDLYALSLADAGRLHCEKQVLSVEQLFDECLAQFSEKINLADLKLKRDYAPSLPQIEADRERLAQVFHNLLENCVRYTDAGGRLSIQIQQQHQHIHLVLEDSAPGVEAAALPRLGERFYRVDASRSRSGGRDAHGGSGLGLALCLRILQMHDARMSFGHAKLGGLAVHLQFPIAKPKAPT